MSKAKVHLAGAVTENGRVTLCGEDAGWTDKDGVTRDFRKATCVYCLRTAILREKQDARRKRFESDYEIAWRSKRIDTLEKGIDVLLENIPC